MNLDKELCDIKERCTIVVTSLMKSTVYYPIKFEVVLFDRYAFWNLSNMILFFNIVFEKQRNLHKQYIKCLHQPDL